MQFRTNVRLHKVSSCFLKVDIEQLRWVAKVTYAAEESYGTRELMEIAKAMTAVSGVQCAWLHPDVQSRYVSTGACMYVPRSM